MKEEIIIFRYLDQELTPNLHKTKFNKIKYFKSNLWTKIFLIIKII